ncbi:anillin isoform X1 [Mobula hypostoma]|uniref:anillin isoform X1 n=2 Tax=Mobula hypostoma TaxID=723540 RepID=UPI002FC357DB
MDPFTEKLLERTRARRENLQRKMAERPSKAVRQIVKRSRDPLSEANNQPSEVSEEAKTSTNPSPSKKRCSDKMETPIQDIENEEPNTPMTEFVAQTPPAINPVAQSPSLIASVAQSSSQPRQLINEQEEQRVKQDALPVTSLKNRMQKLAQQLRTWDSEGNEIDSPVTPTQSWKPASPPPPPQQAVSTVESKTPVGRKGRLANLAAAINSWDDDLSHPIIKHNKPPGQPGTACLPASSATNKDPATTESCGIIQQAVISSQRPLENTVNKTTSTISQESTQSNSHLPKVIPPTSKRTQENKPPLPKGALAPHQLQPGPTKTEKTQSLATRVISSQSQSEFKDQPKRDTVAQSGNSLTTPGGSGVKSFLERFGERCQQYSGTSPTPSTPGQRTPNVTPSTKAIQERLLKQQELSSTANLTQQLKQEREKELQGIRNRFQKNNLWSADKRENCPNSLREDSSEPLFRSSEQRTAEVHRTQMSTVQHSPQSILEPNTKSLCQSTLTEVLEPSAVKISSTESEVTFKEQNVKEVPNNPAKLSPFKRISSVYEQLHIAVDEGEKGNCDRSTDKVEVVREIEMSVDESNSSVVINELFDGVLEEGEEEDEDEEEDGGMKEKQVCNKETESDLEEKNDELNISSMSLLTPLAETVDAVTNQEKNGKPSDNVKEGKCQLESITRATSADNVGSATDDHNLLYSIAAYRSQRVKTVERPSVKQVIVRREDVSQRLEEKVNATPSSINIKQKMKNLNNEINIQQSVIHQASQALSCCTDEDHGKGSQQEAEAERLLLIASEKRLALLAELNKLKGEGVHDLKRGGLAAKSSGECAPSRGCIALSDIRIPLKADFICSTAQKTDVTNYYFFILIKAGALNIVATPLATIQNALCGDAISFPTKFTLEDVSNDFEIETEIYSLALYRESAVTDKKKKPNKSKAITPKRLLTSITKSNLHTPALASPGGPNAVRTSNFSMIGSHKFSLTSVGNSKFQLDKVPFLSPLEGHICVKLQCRVDSMIEERGFLTMFDDVSGFGAWHRRWCVLSGNCISYWTYPDDEKSKNPLGRINLANCTSRRIEPANREFCARPHTFELITARPQREDDRETLVSRCKNTLCVTKNWLSADTKEERNLWMQKLNRALIDLRTWQPGACYSPHILLKEVEDSC